MCCDDLVCARCARPVPLAGCPVCRQARHELHGAGAAPTWAVLPVLLALLLAAAYLASRLS